MRFLSGDGTAVTAGPTAQVGPDGMNPTNVDARFIGRTAELSQLRACADSVQADAATVVLIDGEAGIGKTTLVRHFLLGLDGFRILQASCDHAEANYPFGVIGQLAASVPAQIRASAPLLTGEVPIDAAPFQVGAQLLALLSQLQNDGPVAVIVDDAQWADAASAQVLRFVLRRLWADRVLALLSSRQASIAGGAVAWQRLATGKAEATHLHIDGLDTAEITELAESFGTGELTTSTVARLQAHTGGHPLYLQQLFTDLPAEALHSSTGDLPVPSSLTQVIQQSVRRLAEPSQRLLQAMAVLDARSPLAMVAEVAEVAEVTDGTEVADATAALEPLMATGLIDWWPREPSTPVVIHHQLQRQAIYETLGPVHRRRMHAKAVPLVDQYTAWAHRVAATDTVDAALATRLEHAATAVFTDGMIDHAATWMLWAAELSETRTEHERRILATALFLFQRLSVIRLTQLRPRIEACGQSPLRDALLGYISYTRGEVEQAEQYLTDVLTTTDETPDPVAVAVAKKGFISLYAWMGCSRNDQAREAQVFVRDVPEFGAIDNHTWAMIQYSVFRTIMYTDGPHAARRVIDEADILTELATTDPQVKSLLLLARGINYAFVGDLTAAITDLTALSQTEQPQLAIDGMARNGLSYAQYLSGAWADAAVNADQAIAIANLVDIAWHFPPSYMVAAMIDASRGDWESAEKKTRMCRQYTRNLGAAQEVHPALAEATLAQAKGDYPGILTALTPFLEQLDNGWVQVYRNSWLPLYVEALIGTGALDEAAAALDQLSTEAARTPSLHPVAGWLSGWLAAANGDPQTACAHYTEALAIPLGPDTMFLYRARLEQAYGEALLTLHDRKAALAPLREARLRYAALGARPFLERCATGLHAAGLHAADEAPEQLMALTDREREVVHQLQEGLTNAKIAEELYLSVKTVEYHLSNVYAKYDVTSRHELRKILTASTD